MIVIMFITLIHINNENYDTDDHVDDKETAMMMMRMSRLLNDNYDNHHDYQ